MRHFLSRIISVQARYVMPLLLVLLLMGGAVQAQDTTNVAAKTLALIKVRGGAGTEYPVLTTLAFNSQVVIEARNAVGSWFLIRQEELGVRGWVASRYVSWDDNKITLPNFAVSFEIINGGDAAPESVLPDATPLATGTPALINISGTAARTLARVNLRNAPDFNGGIISIVLFDVTVSIQSRNARGNWLLVETPRGQRGWIAARYLAWDTGEELAAFPVSNDVITPDAAVTLIADAATVIPPSGAIATAAVPNQANDGSTTGTVLVATLNIRAAPEAASRRLVQARMADSVFIEGRTARGDWLLIRTKGEPTYRGWVASRFVGWSDTVPLASFPVSEEIMGGTP